MNKIIFLILIAVGIAYGQSGNPIVDSLSTHRTVINANIADIATNTSGIASNTSGKLSLTGGTMSGNLIFGDSYKVYLGAGSDMSIYHDGANSYINNGTGGLTILTTSGNALSLGVVTPRWYIDGTNYAWYGDAGLDIGKYGSRVDSLYADDIVVTNGISFGNVSATESGYLDGLTSNIQMQLNTKLNHTDVGDTVNKIIDAEVELVNIAFPYPQSGQANIPILLGNKQITELYAVLEVVSPGAGESVIFDLKWGDDTRSGSSLLSSTCTSNQTTKQDFSSSINATYDGQIEATSYVWATINTVSGTVRTITITLGVIEGD